MESNGADRLGRKLLQIKEELEEKKAKRLELQGELKSLMNQLKDLGVNSLEEAEEMIHQMEKDLEHMKETIENQIEEIEELMEDEEVDFDDFCHNACHNSFGVWLYIGESIEREVRKGQA